MSAIAMYPVSFYKKARKFLTGKKEEEGASLVEYGLLVAGIAVLCVVAIYALGGRIRDLFDSITFTAPS